MPQMPGPFANSMADGGDERDQQYERDPRRDAAGRRQRVCWAMSTTRAAMAFCALIRRAPRCALRRLARYVVRGRVLSSPSNA